MRQYIDNFVTAVMGNVTTTDDILEVHQTGNPAGYGILKLHLPMTGTRQFGVSFLVAKQNENHEIVYNTGDMTPNKANIFICDPTDNRILYSLYNMRFDRTMLDGPQLSINIPANNGLQYMDFYIVLGNGGGIYQDYSSAIITDEYGNFMGTHEYIVYEYCKVIYERGEFHEASPHLLTEDMPANIPELFTSDYPDILWRVDGTTNKGMIYSPLIVDRLPMGAFYSATKFKNVTIPKSCLNIGPDTFAETQLKSVTISSNCNYSENSFPPDCVVHFYPNS